MSYDFELTIFINRTLKSTGTIITPHAARSSRNLCLHSLVIDLVVYEKSTSRRYTRAESSLGVCAVARSGRRMGITIVIRQL